MAPTDAPYIELRWGIRIPMRDGIHLNGTLYRPRDPDVPAACILALTPYVSDLYHGVAAYFARNGWSFLIVDVRGRGNSDGAFRPRIQEAQDGHDVVEWLARQSYCNGSVALYGGSYSGYAQWATAREFPPHLATMVPTASPFSGVDSPLRRNIFFPERVQWLTLTSGSASQVKVCADTELWSTACREWIESGRPFRELDTVFGNPSPIFQEWLAHPEPDAYWDAHNPTADQYSRMRLPILTITGSYDDNQPGALEHYKQHISHASPQARSRHFLIIGPWDHAGTQWPSAQFGGLKLGPESVIDIRELHRQWYAWTLQGGPRPALLKKPVTYYVIGAEQWRHADTLEKITGSYQPCFLDSTGAAGDVFSSGSLGPQPGIGAPDQYTYDPRDIQGPEIDAESFSDGKSLIDQSVTLALGGRQLVYHSAPFTADIEVSGFFKLTAWMALDCPDTDFYASVHEIRPDGSSLRLSTDAMRARYREGLRTPKLIDTRRALRYDFEGFTFVACRINRGHRLRLVIAPMGRLGESTFVQKNYNSGGEVSAECSQDGRAVTVRLSHDAAHPSALYVPLGQTAAPDQSQ